MKNLTAEEHLQIAEEIAASVEESRERTVNGKVAHWGTDYESPYAANRIAQGNLHAAIAAAKFAQNQQPQPKEPDFMGVLGALEKAQNWAEDFEQRAEAMRKKAAEKRS